MSEAYDLTGSWGKLPEGQLYCGTEGDNPNWGKCIARANWIAQLITSGIEICENAGWGAFGTSEVFYPSTNLPYVDQISGDTIGWFRGKYYALYDAGSHSFNHPDNQVAYFPITFDEWTISGTISHEGIHAYQASSQDSAYFKDHEADNEDEGYQVSQTCNTNSLPGPTIRELPPRKPRHEMSVLPFALFALALQTQDSTPISPATFRVAIEGIIPSLLAETRSGQGAEKVVISVTSFQKLSRSNVSATEDWSQVATALGALGGVTRDSTCTACPALSATSAAYRGNDLVVTLQISRYNGFNSQGLKRFSTTEFRVVLAKGSDGGYRFHGVEAITMGSGSVLPTKAGGG